MGVICGFLYPLGINGDSLDWRCSTPGKESLMLKNLHKLFNSIITCLIAMNRMGHTVIRKMMEKTNFQIGNYICNYMKLLY